MYIVSIILYIVSYNRTSSSSTCFWAIESAQSSVVFVTDVTELWQSLSVLALSWPNCSAECKIVHGESKGSPSKWSPRSQAFAVSGSWMRPSVTTWRSGMRTSVCCCCGFEIKTDLENSRDMTPYRAHGPESHFLRHTIYLSWSLRFKNGSETFMGWLCLMFTNVTAHYQTWIWWAQRQFWDRLASWCRICFQTMRQYLDWCFFDVAFPHSVCLKLCRVHVMCCDRKLILTFCVCAFGMHHPACNVTSLSSFHSIQLYSVNNKGGNIHSEWRWTSWAVKTVWKEEYTTLYNHTTVKYKV